MFLVANNTIRLLPIKVDLRSRGLKTQYIFGVNVIVFQKKISSVRNLKCVPEC